MSHVIGIDLGGSKIALGLVSPENEILARRRIDTNADAGLQSVIERIAGEIEALKIDAGGDGCGRGRDRRAGTSGSHPR